MGEDAADQDCPTLVSFLIVELAAAVAKLADGRRRESAVGAAGIVEAPLARSRIVEAQGRNSIWPEGPSASSSTRLAFPFQTFRTWETPSQCFHVVELARGFASRSTWTFQLPSSKSKSCAPSCRGGGAGCCARAAGINREPTQRKRSILGNARRCFWFIIPGLLFHGCGGRWLRARMHFPVIWLPDGNRHHNREPCCPARVDYGLPVDGGRECHRRQVEPDLPYWLDSGTRRFNHLRRLMPDISHKVLTETLRSLKRKGLITRTVYAEVPSRVEYSISEHGQSLRPLIEVVLVWGHGHIQWLTGAQERV